MYRIEYNLQNYGYKTNPLANRLGTFTAVMPPHPVIRLHVLVI